MTQSNFGKQSANKDSIDYMIKNSRYSVLFRQFYRNTPLEMFRRKLLAH